MIVDDEPDALFTYESFLSDEGYNVESFTDSLEALSILSSYQILLLITS
jgi:DNA-binding response OmpR family regulator